MLSAKPDYEQKHGFQLQKWFLGTPGQTDLSWLMVKTNGASILYNGRLPALILLFSAPIQRSIAPFYVMFDFGDGGSLTSEIGFAVNVLHCALYYPERLLSELVGRLV